MTRNAAPRMAVTSDGCTLSHVRFLRFHARLPQRNPLHGLGRDARRAVDVADPCDMLRYTVYRLLWLVPTLLAMALVTFLVMHATPGSPLDPVAEGANPLSPDAQKNLAAVYGLDKPLWHQFLIFLGKAVQGDFGQSFVYKTRTVTEIMRETFPISLFLGSMALALAILGGITLGVLAAVYQNRSWD